MAILIEFSQQEIDVMRCSGAWPKECFKIKLGSVSTRGGNPLLTERTPSRTQLTWTAM